MDELQVLEVLKDSGPLTGKQLRDAVQGDELSLWRLCRTRPGIRALTVGRRYLRLDRNIDGYARLSPSIKREFLTYTVCGLETDGGRIEEAASALRQATRDISRAKRALALEAMERAVKAGGRGPEILDHACFVLAGDIVFEMAHVEPRPEISTGRLVRGSDLDIIVVAEDECSRDILDRLDKDIHQEKYRCLVDPDRREEIDYVIKNVSRVGKQMAFDTFEHMIAAKILWEGHYLCGSRDVFDQIKRLLVDEHIPEKIAELEARAWINRRDAEASLLDRSQRMPEEECLKLFFTREEAEEIF